MKKFIILIIVTIILFSFSCNKKEEIYYCPMHTFIVRNQPGTCPICGMDLVKKEVESHNHEESNKLSASDHIDPSIIENFKSVYVPNEQQIELGIKTVKVNLKELNKMIYSTGTVTYDTELYTALKEYKESLKFGKEFSTGAKLKLEQMGLSDSFIRDWSSGKKDPSELITGGKGNVSHVTSNIYEQDIQFIKIGQKISLTVSSFGGKIFKGTIRHIDRIFDEKTRTLKIRIEVEDFDNLLRPQMFVKVEIKSGSGKGLVIPRSAVIDTGERQIVYVKNHNNGFSGRLVRLGSEIGEFVEVVSGLKKGEEVVESGNFFIDSESRLQFGENDVPFYGDKK